MSYTNLNLNAAKHGSRHLSWHGSFHYLLGRPGSNMEKADIVNECIDLHPIYLNSNANGYPDRKTRATNTWFAFSPGKGQNRVWKVSITHRKGCRTVQQNVASGGLAVYGQSHEVHASRAA